MHTCSWEPVIYHTHIHAHMFLGACDLSHAHIHAHMFLGACDLSRTHMHTCPALPSVHSEQILLWLCLEVET